MPRDSNTYTSEINSRKKEQKRAREKAQCVKCPPQKHEDPCDTKGGSTQLCRSAEWEAMAAGRLELTGQSV